MNKLFIIDAVNLLFRSYYAIGPMTNPKGESTNALFGFIRSIYKLMKDFSPSHLVAVFDGPESKKRRTNIYSEYKSHRKGMPEDLFPQLERAIHFCELAGIPYLSIPGVEADDTMGSIALWAAKKHIEVYLCTSDKDLCQLVSDHIFVINISKDNLRIDRNKVKELFGVTPEQMTDYLAMTGDPSDNIPGLEGFGPKTATSLLMEFGSLESILAHPEKVPGQKKQETLKSGREIALLSKELATIHTDVDFPKEEDFFLYKKPSLSQLKEFYHDMHFMSLLKELDTPQDLAKSHLQEETNLQYTCIDDESSLEELRSILAKEREICIDTQTTDIRPMHAELVGIGLCAHPKKAWYLPVNGRLGKKRMIEFLKSLFLHPHCTFYGHNIKYDLHIFQKEGIPFPKISFDTMLASYLISPQKQKHHLDELILERFSQVKTPLETLTGKGKNQISMDRVPIAQVCNYCCEDVDYTCRLKNVLKKELIERELTSVLETIELPLIPILTEMEHLGIFVDVEKLHQMSLALSKQLSSLQHQIYHLAEETFNLNSPKQLSQILFEKLKIKPPKKIATGYSTSADVLESLQEAHPIVQKILEYRTLEKLRSTYVDALPGQIHPQTHRIHCTFNQSVAATGRLSCQNPNLQNIPIRSTEGKKIREAFHPQSKDWSFLSGDYSQIELRLLAHLSEDPSLLKAFNEGEDIHAFTASLVFNVPLKEVTPEMRDRAKAVNFGILYGQQAFGLSQGLSIDFKEAASFIDTYFLRYKKVKDFFEFCKEAVRKTGRAVTMTGRQRPIPDIHSKNPIIRSAAERLAINTPLQGTAADLIKIAMIQLSEHLHKEKNLGRLILQIHDELLLEAPESQIPKLSQIVQHTMENVFILKIPLVVHISIGKNWGEC